jgi:hypothetical protein
MEGLFDDLRLKPGIDIGLSEKHTSAEFDKGDLPGLHELGQGSPANLEIFQQVGLAHYFFGHQSKIISISPIMFK